MGKKFSATLIASPKKTFMVTFSVPPQISDLESSPSTVSVRENNNASLICKADGTPDPKIEWRREDGKKIILKKKKKDGKKGESLHFGLKQRPPHLLVNFIFRKTTRPWRSPGFVANFEDRNGGVSLYRQKRRASEREQEDNSNRRV